MRERHSERKNACYTNPDIDPDRRLYNIYFKEPSGTYTECFDKLVQEGTISTRGLKPDANIVCEFVFDVNTAWLGETDYDGNSLDVATPKNDVMLMRRQLAESSGAVQWNTSAYLNCSKDEPRERIAEAFRDAEDIEALYGQPEYATE